MLFAAFTPENHANWKLKKKTILGRAKKNDLNILFPELKYKL